MNFAGAQKLARTLPGVEEGTSYRTPAFRVRKKFLARLLEDGETLVVKLLDDEERETLMAMDPKTFFTTDHYRGHPAILISLPRVEESMLQRILEQAWRDLASQRMIQQYESMDDE